MPKKINSEINIDSEDFKIRIGTVDKKNPEVMYLSAETYITPQEEQDSYEEDIESMTSDMKDYLDKLIKKKPMIEKRYIFTTDIASSRMSIGKKTRLSIQVHFIPSRTKFKKDMTFGDIANKISKSYSDSLGFFQDIIEDYAFVCSKTKK